jgi:hypothetical protein
MGWVTIKGSAVFIDDNGVITKGNVRLQSLVSKKLREGGKASKENAPVPEEPKDGCFVSSKKNKPK